MLRFITMLQTQLANREEGATAVEYALMLALISAVVITLLLAVSGSISNVWAAVSGAFASLGY